MLSWYYSLIYRSFNVSDLISDIEPLQYPFSYRQSFSNFSAPLKDLTSIILECLVISLKIWSVWLSFPMMKIPVVLMNVAMCEHWTIDNFLTRLSLLILCKLSSPIACRKHFLYPFFFGEISKQNFHVVLRELIQYTLQFLIKPIFHVITFILSCFMHIQNNNITQTTSYNYIRHPVTNKFHPLNSRYDFLM